MRTATLTLEPRGILRYSTWDALFVVLAIAHGLLLVAVPVLPIIAIGVWWNSNTISHNFIHKPFFRARPLNWLCSLYLSVLLGIPQSIWRDRHLAHHAGVPWRVRVTPQMVVEVLAVFGLWAALLAIEPAFFLTIYLPGYLIGLGICSLHGHYEHVLGTTSHHGRLYNLLFFNDGYHVEHHANPGTHWTQLPHHVRPGTQTNRWPAVLRWLDGLSLEALERRVLRSKCLQRFMLQTHERAFRALLPKLPPVRSVGIVGGGLFPRTALILQRLLPEARLVVIDASDENLHTARTLVSGVEFVHGYFDPARHNGFDLIVIPLSFMGDRAAVYRQPSAPATLVHDWIWHRRAASAVVSVFLLKRLNFIDRRAEGSTAQG